MPKQILGKRNRHGKQALKDLFAFVYANDPDHNTTNELSGADLSPCLSAGPKTPYNSRALVESDGSPSSVLLWFALLDTSQKQSVVPYVEDIVRAFCRTFGGGDFAGACDPGCVVAISIMYVSVKERGNAHRRERMMFLSNLVCFFIASHPEAAARHLLLHRAASSSNYDGVGLLITVIRSGQLADALSVDAAEKVLSVIGEVAGSLECTPDALLLTSAACRTFPGHSAIIGLSATLVDIALRLLPAPDKLSWVHLSSAGLALSGLPAATWGNAVVVNALFVYAEKVRGACDTLRHVIPRVDEGMNEATYVMKDLVDKLVAVRKTCGSADRLAYAFTCAAGGVCELFPRPPTVSIATLATLSSEFLPAIGTDAFKAVAAVVVRAAEVFFPFSSTTTGDDDLAATTMSAVVALSSDTSHLSQLYRSGAMTSILPFAFWVLLLPGPRDRRQIVDAQTFVFRVRESMQYATLDHVKQCMDMVCNKDMTKIRAAVAVCITSSVMVDRFPDSIHAVFSEATMRCIMANISGGSGATNILILGCVLAVLAASPLLVVDHPAHASVAVLRTLAMRQASDSQIELAMTVSANILLSPDDASVCLSHLDGLLRVIYDESSDASIARTTAIGTVDVFLSSPELASAFPTHASAASLYVLSVSNDKATKATAIRVLSELPANTSPCLDYATDRYIRVATTAMGVLVEAINAGDDTNFVMEDVFGAIKSVMV